MSEAQHEQECSISVVVPARNSPGQLEQLIEALGRQTLASGAFEVIISG